ncbi:hypothetical protein AGDE_04392 [Angomonas deanei]|nr:hypothetical protein AGDE_04392 [Angomonas deanei]|eukprot:EPY39536.1 hypothetical protein AGDE_04392 [Angomonas deanei]
MRSFRAALPKLLSLPLSRRHQGSQVTQEEEERDWILYQGDKYGEGNYQLFRPLYKELCDEVRREYYAKPPPPLETKEPAWVGGEGKAEDNGRWSTRYSRAHNTLVFTRPAMPRAGLGRVAAYATVELKNPDKLNDVLLFADWFPIEVFVERKNIVLHFSIAANEGGMHMRNVRAYDATAAPTEADVDWLELLMDGTTLEAAVVRHEHFYDGPCLLHLELDLQGELYDVMQDHGVHLEWVRWAASWVFYAEHLRYTRWGLDLLETLIPTAVQGPEEDFLLEAERELLDEPVEDWLPAHAL